MTQRTFKNVVIICLSIIIAGAFLFLYYTWDPAAPANYFPSCPSKAIFNFHCPGCGSQRALHALLNGEFMQAWAYNPALIVLGPMAILLVVQFILKHVFNIYWKIALFENNYFLISLVVLLLAYMVLRNIPTGTFEYLRPRKL